MNLNLVRWIDYWIGIPLTGVLSLFDALRSCFSGSEKLHPKKVLFIELSEMGSAIIAHSAMVRAIDEVGVDNVYFLIFARNRESVDLLDLIPADQVILIDDDSLPEFLVSMFKAIFLTWRLKIDTTIDLELFSRFTALFSYATGAVIRVGYHRFTNEGLFRGTFMNRAVVYNNHQHMALNFLALVEAAFSNKLETPRSKRDVSGDMKELPRLTISDERRNKVDRWLAPLRSSCRKIVVINPHPGILLPIRGWPLSHFSELVTKIVAEKPDWGVVIVGLSEASDYARTICRAAESDRVIDLTGITESLLELLALLDQADLFVTNDSGPAHFSSLVRAASIVLFGPETSRLYGPLHPEATSLSSGLACSPCFSAYNHRTTACTDNRCLQEISPQRVYDTSVRVLSGLRVVQG